jgi:hypothetical protein
MQDTAQLRQLAIDKLNKLPQERLIEVLDFIDFVILRSREQSDTVSSQIPAAPRGSLEDLLACVGTWKFEPGELEEILQDIEQSRLMELDEQNDELLA